MFPEIEQYVFLSHACPLFFRDRSGEKKWSYNGILPLQLLYLMNIYHTYMNRVVHFEIHAKDPDRMQHFYSDVFGWNITNLGEQMGNYHMVVTGEDASGEKWPGINGGITPRMGDIPKSGQAVNAFVCTISVDNLEQYIEKVKNAGGSMALDKMEVPGVGWLAYCKDIEENIFGLLQPH